MPTLSKDAAVTTSASEASKTHNASRTATEPPRAHSTSRTVTGPSRAHSASHAVTQPQPKQYQVAVSVIMPAYNVSAYLERAVECLWNQTFTNWELIIVDDAAQDETGALAEKLAARDQRISVIHHTKNCGVASARNTGMAQAQGKYLWFCDPDDTFEKDLLDLCMSALVAHPAQALVFGVSEDFYNEEDVLLYTQKVTLEEAHFKSAAELRPHVLTLEQKTCYGYPWNKIFCLDYLKQVGVKFKDYLFIEDILFNIQAFQNLQSLTILKATPYHYASRLKKNLTNTYSPEYFPLHKMRIQALLDQQKSWGTYDDEARAVLGSLYARYVLSAAERNCDPRSGLDHAGRIAWCKEQFSDELFNELIPFARAVTSRILHLGLKPLQAKNATATVALARLIHLVRHRSRTFYTKAKAGR